MYGFLLTPAGPMAGVAPLASWVEVVCTDCDTQWTGDDGCWSCGKPGQVKAEMHGPERLVWGFSNQFSPNYEKAEGAPL